MGEQAQDSIYRELTNREISARRNMMLCRWKRLEEEIEDAKEKTLEREQQWLLVDQRCGVYECSGKHVVLWLGLLVSKLVSGSDSSMMNGWRWNPTLWIGSFNFTQYNNFSFFFMSLSYTFFHLLFLFYNGVKTAISKYKITNTIKKK